MAFTHLSKGFLHITAFTFGSLFSRFFKVRQDLVSGSWCKRAGGFPGCIQLPGILEDFFLVILRHDFQHRKSGI